MASPSSFGPALLGLYATIDRSQRILGTLAGANIPLQRAYKAVKDLYWAGEAVKGIGALDKAPELLAPYLGGSGKDMYINLAEAKQRMVPFLEIDNLVLMI